MKSRHKKHLLRIMKRSPIIAFSKEDLFQKGEKVLKSDFPFAEGLEDKYVMSTSYKEIKQEMESNVIMFTDNYLISGGNHYFYLLLPIQDGKYQIREKEMIAEWQKNYWKKEDPFNKRDWAYFDEDVNDLFDYIMTKFDKYK